MKLRVVLIGLGMMGSRWAQALEESPDFEAVAYVSPSADRRAQLKEKLDLEQFPGFSTVMEALRAVDAEIAIVATPSHLHYEVCIAVLESGLATIVEKPLETDWAKAKAIVAEAAKRGLPLLVDQNYRYTAPLSTLRNSVLEGALGRPGYATVIHHRNRPAADTYQQHMPDPMLLDMSIHHFDAMRYVFKREVVSVLAHSWNPAWSDYTGDANVDVILEFEDDLWITYSGSNASRGITIHPFANWRIELEKGGLYLESDGYDLQLYRVPVGAPPKYKEPIEFDSWPLQNQAYILQHFKDCLERGVEPETSGRDNLRSLAVAMAIIDSCDRGQRVCLKEYFT